MKRIIITESQYKRLLTEKMVSTIGGDSNIKVDGIVGVETSEELKS